MMMKNNLSIDADSEMSAPNVVDDEDDGPLLVNGRLSHISLERQPSGGSTSSPKAVEVKVMNEATLTKEIE